METGELTRREYLHRLSRVARAGVVPVERAAEAWGAPTREAALRLARLRRGGWVRHVRRGVYYLPPLDVGAAEVVAEDSWVLADELFAPCYIGGWTAAGHWGLTEQLFRTTFVVTAATVRSSEMEALGTSFRLAIVPADRLSGCVEARRGATRVNVSTPERTLVDAFRRPDWVGGIRHLAEILRTYAGLGADAEDRLVGELERHGNGAAHKRAGYIAGMVWPAAERLIEVARGGVTTGVVKLDPAIASRGRMLKQWGLWINADVGGADPSARPTPRARGEVHGSHELDRSRMEDRVAGYTDGELEQMLFDVESELVERKESFKGDVATKAREVMCAFANDLPAHGRPGVLFIGARDDGSPAGLTVTDELLRQLADIKTDGNIVPPPTLTVTKHVLRGADMAVVTVWPADSPPVRYKGRIWIRIGPRRALASAQDERILNEKRRAHDQPFDVQPVRPARIDDLDLVRFAEYLQAAVAPEILESNDRTQEQRLAATKMIVSADDPTPTVLGLLVIGANTRSFLPGAYVQFLRVEGTDLAGSVVDELAIDGTVSDMIRRLDEKLVAHNRTRVDFTSAPRELRASLYPVIALQQLTRNAILHRTYEGTNAPARVTWYDDRIEITSPGGPYGEVTRENFGTPGITDYRNPNLAEAMRALGYVQKFGGGIVAARSAMERNGNPPPEFRVDAGYVMAVLRGAS